MYAVVSYCVSLGMMCFVFSSRRRHTRCSRDWSSDVCSSDLYGDINIWLRTWSDNRKPQTVDYIRQGTRYGIEQIGGVSNGTEYILEQRNLLFYSNAILDQWTIKPSYNINQAYLKIMKVETNTAVSTPTQDYQNTLKVTIVDNVDNTHETQWYAANIGMVKTTIKSTNSSSTIYLVRQEQLVNIPVTSLNEKFIATNAVVDYRDEKLLDIYELVNSDLSFVFVSFLLSGELGTPVHREAFQAVYNLHLAVFALALTNEIISIAQQYALEPITIEKIINEARANWIAKISVDALIHNIENSEFFEKVLTDTASVFQESINILNSTNIMDSDINLITITSIE